MMRSDDDRLNNLGIDQLLADLPPQDMRPAAKMRIEGACLERLRRRKTALLLPVSATGVLEAVFASLMGGIYLLATLARALTLYGIRFH